MSDVLTFANLPWRAARATTSADALMVVTAALVLTVGEPEARRLLPLALNVQQAAREMGMEP